MFNDNMVLVMDLYIYIYICVCVCGNVNNTTWAFKSGPVLVQCRTSKGVFTT